MSTATITSKGQVTIPKSIRKRLDLQSGDTLRFEVDSEGSLSVTPVKRKTDDTFGILYRPGQEALMPEDMDAGVAEYFKNKYRVS